MRRLLEVVEVDHFLNGQIIFNKGEPVEYTDLILSGEIHFFNCDKRLPTISDLERGYHSTD